MLMLPLLLALAAAPTTAAFKAAVQAMAPEPTLKIRRLACTSAPEEPTEFTCRYQKAVKGKWQSWSTVIARDASGWSLVDVPGPVSR